MFRLIALVLISCFLLNTVLPAYALNSVLPMPAPGTLTQLSAPADPTLLRGLIIDPQKPFHFDAIIRPGATINKDETLLREDVTRLIKYFLASLATPEDDLWVNLSPVEKDRIMAPDFGKTEMGRDLLAQDYLLKQITASLLHPDSTTGKAFWDELYKKAYAQFGTTDIPLDAFNKVWITPDYANVYTNGPKAYIMASRLKVQLESDYLATNNANIELDVGAREDTRSSPTKSPSPLPNNNAKQIMREVVLPVLEKEVNEGAHFATLRQIYQALILSAWFKRKLQGNVLNKNYSDRNKNAGLEFKGLNEKAIYAQYIGAYQKGAFNFIRDEQAPGEDSPIPRKYFSGGVLADKAELNKAISFTDDAAGITEDATEQRISVDLVGFQQELSQRVSQPADKTRSITDNTFLLNIFPQDRDFVRTFLTAPHPLKQKVFAEVDALSNTEVIRRVEDILKQPIHDGKGLLLYDTTLTLRTLFLRTTTGNEDIPQAFSSLFLLSEPTAINRYIQAAGEASTLNILSANYLLFKALLILDQDIQTPFFRDEDLNGATSLLTYYLSKDSVMHFDDEFEVGANTAERFLSFGDLMLNRLFEETGEPATRSLDEIVRIFKTHPFSPIIRSITIYLTLLDILEGKRNCPIAEKENEIAAWKKELTRTLPGKEAAREKYFATNSLLREANAATIQRKLTVDASEETKTPEVRRKFIFLNPYHIHNRPSAMLSLLASRMGNTLGVTILVRKEDYDQMPMTSVMGLLGMFITYSQEIELVIQGQRSTETLTKILNLAERAMQDWKMLEEGNKNNPLYDAYLKEIDQIAQEETKDVQDSSAQQTPGGIDLDPRHMRLDETSASVIDQTNERIPSADILAELTGLVPIIGTIRPTGDLKILLTQ